MLQPSRGWGVSCEEGGGGVIGWGERVYGGRSWGLRGAERGWCWGEFGEGDCGGGEWSGEVCESFL